MNPVQAKKVPTLPPLGSQQIKSVRCDLGFKIFPYDKLLDNFISGRPQITNLIFRGSKQIPVYSELNLHLSKYISFSIIKFIIILLDKTVLLNLYKVINMILQSLLSIVTCFNC